MYKKKTCLLMYKNMSSRREKCVSEKNSDSYEATSKPNYRKKMVVLNRKEIANRDRKRAGNREFKRSKRLVSKTGKYL